MKLRWRLIISPNWRNWVLAVIGMLILSNLYVTTIHQIVDMPTSSDFYKFYLSSERLLQNQVIYWPLLKRSSPGDLCYLDPSENTHSSAQTLADDKACLHPNLNPPIFAVLTLPLALLDYAVAWWVWSSASIFCGILALVLIFRTGVWSALRSPATATLIGVVFFGYFPTFANVSYGQVALFLLLILTLGWLALRRGDDWLAGFWLGVAASLKPFVGLFLLMLLFSRNWRAATSFLLVCAGAFLLGGLIAGFASYPVYLAALADITWLAASWNASFAGFFSRIFGGSENTPWIDAPLLAKGLTTVCSLTVLGFLARCALRPAGADRTLQADRVFALTLPAMLLLSPLGWIYYFPLLFITLVVVWNLAVPLPKHRIYRLILILGVAPTVIPTALIPSADMNTPIDWFFGAGVYFYTLLIIFALVTSLSAKLNI